MPSTIYSVSISDEFVRDCFNKEDGKSSLVQSLLHDYYKSKIVGYMSKEQVEDYKYKIQKKKVELEKEEVELTKAEKELLNEKIEKEEKEKNSQDRQERLKQERLKTFASFLKHWFVLEDLEAEKLSRIYEEETDKDKITLYEFGESMQLKPKEQDIK